MPIYRRALLRWPLMLLLLLPLLVNAQTQMGDTPCDAPTVPVTFGCPVNSAVNQYTSPITFTDFLGGATCNGVEKPVDAWVKFTATTNSTAITWTEVGVRNSVFYVYEETLAGTCPGVQPVLSNITCVNQNPSGIGQTEFVEITTTPGTEYYIRIKRIVDVSDDSQDGYLCVAGCQMTVNQTIDSIASCKDSCDGGASVTPFNGAMPITYLWPATTGFQGDSVATDLCDGVYTVTVTDQGGCAVTTNVTMAEPLAFTLSVDSVQVSCYNGDNGLAIAFAGGGTAPYTYTWDAATGNQTTSTATGLVAGTYTVTVSDAGTCSEVVSTTVWQPDTITYDYSVTDATCPGENDGAIQFFNFSGGNTSFIFSDDSAITYQTDSNFLFLTAGTYWMAVIDSFGCGDTLPIVVDEPDSIHFTGIPLDLTCATSCDGSIALVPNGGTAPYSYFWSNFLWTPSITNLCAGDYSVTVTDALGCTNDTTITVNQPDTIKLSSFSITNTCHGGMDGVAQVFTDGGVGPFTFNWTGTASNADSVWNLAAGTYHVTATDANGCAAATSVVVSEPLPIDVMPTVTPDTLCIGEVATFAVSAAGGNGSPYTFVWNGVDTIDTFTETMQASLPFSVMGIDANGCQSAVEILNVFVWPPINANAILGNTILCEEESTFITASATGGTGGPYTFSFDGGSWVGASTQQNVTPAAYPDTSFYSVVVEDGCNPSQTIDLFTTYHISPVIDITYDVSSGCEPHTVQLTNNSSPVLSTVTWNLDDGGTNITTSDASIFYTYDEPGIYWPEITVISAANNCQLTRPAIVPVEVYANPVAKFRAAPQPTTIIDTEIQFTDLSEGEIYLWQWQFFDTDLVTQLGASLQQSPAVEYPAIAGEYPVSLQVTTIYNCTDIEYKRVKIDEDHTLWLPLAFTPNGDGENDTFFPKGVGISAERYTFTIWNRFGEKLFETNDKDAQWDGRDNSGNALPTGVYVWQLTYRNVASPIDNDRQQYGSVTLIR